MSGLRVGFLACIVALVSILTCQPSHAQSCPPISIPANEHYARAKANVSYADCMRGHIVEQTVRCRSRPDPIEQRMCLQNVIFMGDLSAAITEYHHWARTCAESRQPRDCEAQQEADKRLLDKVQSLVGM